MYGVMGMGLVEWVQEQGMAWHGGNLFTSVWDMHSVFKILEHIRASVRFHKQDKRGEAV